MRRTFEELLLELGKRITEERNKKGYTTEEFSEKTGIRERYIKRIEAGKAVRITTTHLSKICHALKIKPSELFRDL